MKLSEISTFSKQEYVNCIVEIPAGTNKKIEFNKATESFLVDRRDNKERLIEYLPYPANYGFIASTYSNPVQGGDGDALDMLVICESLPTGTVIEAIPIAVLKLLDAGEHDYKVICIPANPELRTVSATTFSEFREKYPRALELIAMWFSNYDPHDTTLIEGWGDEDEALSEIRKSVITPR